MKASLKFLPIVVLSFFVNVATSQNLETSIKVQAMEMQRALLKQDFNAFYGFIHPKIVESIGGKERLKINVDSASSAMKQFGVEIKKIIIGNPGPVINYKGQLQSVVPQTTTLQTAMGELVVETSLIATSDDKGKRWYFTDANLYHAQLKAALPDLSPALVIPQQKQPTFTPKKAD